MKASKVSLFKVGIAVLLIFTGLWSFTSCQDIKKPSFIIIAADQLSFNSFSCSEEQTVSISGLNTLCLESIRFTNAFTTSTQTAAAMGSLLSGAYPYRHHLHRSFDRINSELPLLQEFFKSANYRTSFWSGKPTLLKKTGLSRGFDFFDDTSLLNFSMYSINFKEQANLFENWVRESSAPYFSVIYTSELESLNEGETQISTLENFDEKLGNFFNKLKAANQWDSNYIIVLGLQGDSEYSRPNESMFSNLHSENTNIPFFIKPPLKNGAELKNSKIDTAVNLADLGYSLIKTINSQYFMIQDIHFPIWDFSSLWNKNEKDNLPDLSRKLIIETTNTWKRQLEIRFALLFKNYLFIESKENEFYNKLTDELETIELIKTQKEILNEDLTYLDDIRKNINAKKWTQYLPPDYKWVISNREYWSKPNSRSSVFLNEKNRILKEKTSQPLSTLLIYFQDPKIEKNTLFEEARRNSYNLSLENIWGLWNSDNVWPSPKL